MSRIREEKESSVYVQFTGLTLDDQGTALDGFACVSNHDLRFSGNVIVNTGGAGIATVGCNYVVADRNILNHTGYLPSGAPQDFSGPCGISFHNNACSDAYAGFHFVAASNIIVGEVDQIDGASRTQVTDGNGIIDANLSCSSGAVPPASLVLNNLIYGNGGRCIEANQVSNAWLVITRATSTTSIQRLRRARPAPSVRKIPATRTS